MERVVSFGYNLAMHAWFPVIGLKYTYDRFVHDKYKGILLQKIGLKRQKIKSKKAKQTIWIHATSYGETLSTKKIVNELAKGENVHIIFSTFTTTGYDLAKTFEGIDQVIILPTDIKRICRRLVSDISPDLFILTESDYWLNVLQEVKRKKIQTLLIGGRMSDRSFKRFSYFSTFSTLLFSHFDRFLLQDEDMAQKFLDLGISKDKMSVIGNLKIDNMISTKTVKSLNLPTDRTIITIGSTHDLEEKKILTALKDIQEDVTFVLAPRRPDRFFEVEQILNSLDIAWRKIDDEGNGNERVIFVNKLGVLEDCYKYSDIAIVCGSFNGDIGGHNVYEPVRQGCRVLYGPHMYNQKSLTSIVEDLGFGESVELSSLKNKVKEYLALGRLSLEESEKVKEKSSDVTKKSLNAIKSLLKKNGVCYN